MKQRWVAALLAGLLLLAGAVVFWIPSSRRAIVGDAHAGPSFDGRPTSYWRAELVSELDAGKKESQEVAVALQHGGAEAAPVLIDLLADPDPRVGRVALYFLTVHFAGHVGPEGQAAVEPLTKLLHDDDPMVRRRAVQSLGYLGARAKAAVRAIAVLLKDEEEMVAWHAALALGNMGGDARPALGALREAQKDPRAMVRIGAAAAVKRIDQSGGK